MVPPNDPPKRRWFRFSVRTMFVVVTVFGCWLGYELNWIRQRRELLAENGVIHRAERDTDAALEIVPAAPGLLWLFGETGVAYIGLTAEGREFDQLTEHDHERIRQIHRLFTEAQVGVWIIDGHARHQFPW